MELDNRQLRKLLDDRKAALEAYQASRRTAPGHLASAVVSTHEQLQVAALENFEPLLDAADERDVLRVVVDDLWNHLNEITDLPPGANLDKLLNPKTIALATKIHLILEDQRINQFIHSDQERGL